MSNLIIPILGKHLMERWGMNAYEILQIIKKYEPKLIGSFNTKVEVARLISAEDEPNNLDHIISLIQFDPSYVLETEKKLNLLSGKLSTADQDKVFPCKTGTKWEDVGITLKSHDTVMIKTPEGTGRYNFSELNMKDGRSDIPTKSWKLLMYFCRYSGRITSETTIYDIPNLSKARSNLNKTLQGIFGIYENFCKIYNKNDGWVAKCIFNDKTEST